MKNRFSIFVATTLAILFSILIITASDQQKELNQLKITNQKIKFTVDSLKTAADLLDAVNQWDQQRQLDDSISNAHKHLIK